MTSPLGPHASILNGGGRKAWIAWVLLITVFALWAILSILSKFLGGWNSRGGLGGAVPAAAGGAAGAAVGGAPGAAVGAGGAALAASAWYNRSYNTSRAFRDLLWLLLIPILTNTVFGWWHASWALIVSIFAIGLVWAFLRFITRLFDFGWIVLAPLAVAAAVLPLARTEF